MHPLLPFYGFMSLLALASVSLRTRLERSVLRLASWGAMLIIGVAIAFRPIKIDIQDDTWRYSLGYIRWRELSLFDLLAQAPDNQAFRILNWIVGQVSADIRPLIVLITIFCITMLWRSLRQSLPPLYACIGMLLYSTYPFWVFYVGSGIKQALAMALLMQAYVDIQQRRWLGWVWLLLAPGFHNSALIIIPFLLAHLALWRPSFGYRRALTLSLSFLLLCIALSVTNLNQPLLTFMQDYVAPSSDQYRFYLDENLNREYALAMGYKTGFRLEFTLFSLLPLFAALWLRRQGHGLSFAITGWWINFYALLIGLYHLFTFVNSSDRIAAYGWFLVPMMLLIMVAETRAKRPLQIVLLVFAIANVLMLQFYTGDALRIEF